MEKYYTFLLLPLIFFLFYSCSIDTMQEKLSVEGEHGFNFQESKSAWKKLKKEHGNSYVYTVLEQSWTGHGSETTIEVEKGKVKGRSYIAFTISDEDGSRSITDRYEERSRREIGSHSLGAPPYTTVSYTHLTLPTKRIV